LTYSHIEKAELILTSATLFKLRNTRNDGFVKVFQELFPVSFIYKYFLAGVTAINDMIKGTGYSTRKSRAITETSFQVNLYALLISYLNIV